MVPGKDGQGARLEGHAHGIHCAVEYAPHLVVAFAMLVAYARHVLEVAAFSAGWSINVTLNRLSSKCQS